MMIAIPSVIGLMVLGGPVIQLIFPRYDSNSGAMMLRIGAIAVAFYTMSTVTTSALQGVDRMNLPVKHSFNLWELYCEIGYRQEIIKTYIIPLVCSVIMGAVALGTYKLIFMFTQKNTVSVIPALIIAVVVYFGQLYLCKKRHLYF